MIRTFCILQFHTGIQHQQAFDKTFPSWEYGVAVLIQNKILLSLGDKHKGIDFAAMCSPFAVVSQGEPI